MTRRVGESREDYLARQRERRRADPAWDEHLRAQSTANSAIERARHENDPAWQASRRLGQDRWRERHESDPEWVERRRLASNASSARHAESHQDDPVYRARQRAGDARYRSRHRDDPDWRSRNSTANFTYREGLKAADPDGWACLGSYRHAQNVYGAPDFTYETWAAIWYGPCFDCGVTPARGVDHIIGMTRNGTNTLDNLQPACVTCNSRKAVRTRDGIDDLVDAALTDLGIPLT